MLKKALISPAFLIHKMGEIKTDYFETNFLIFADSKTSS